MILGKVVEQIVASDKHATLKGHHLFWVQPVTITNGAEVSTNGDAFIALNSVGAGPGDTVLVCNEGTGCRQIFDIAGPFPVNHVIAGFVDSV